jgi:integrase
MARTIRDAKMESRASRARLQPGAPHFKTLVPAKVHLGYHRRVGADGTWFVRVYVGKGPTGVSNYKVAQLGRADDLTPDDGLTYEEAMKAALAHPLAHGEAAPPVGALTVGDVIASYVKWLAAHRATSEDAGLRAAKLILPELGRLKVTELTTSKLSKWRDTLAATPKMIRTRPGEPQKYGRVPTTPEEKRARRASANRVLKTLKAALNKAFQDGAISDDTSWRRLKGFDRVDAARPGFLTVAEAQRLINAADAPSGFRNLVRGTLMTGARYGELCALRCQDYAFGKVHISHSKSGRARNIVLTDEGQAFFEGMTTGRDPKAPLFPRTDGTAWQSSQQARRMTDACRAARIEPPIGIHALRHTWASLSVMGGVPLMIVAANLGHSSTSMVERHYGHLTESYFDSEIKKGAPTFGMVETSNVVALDTIKGKTG